MSAYIISAIGRKLIRFSESIDKLWLWMTANRHTKTYRGSDDLIAPRPSCSHPIWRNIAAPYVKQCRTCGTVVFREDVKGDFPDGLTEYVEAVRLGGTGREIMERLGYSREEPNTFVIDKEGYVTHHT